MEIQEKVRDIVTIRAGKNFQLFQRKRFKLSEQAIIIVKAR